MDGKTDPEQSVRMFDVTIPLHIVEASVMWHVYSPFVQQIPRWGLSLLGEHPCDVCILVVYASI